MSVGLDFYALLQLPRYKMYIFPAGWSPCCEARVRRRVTLSVFTPGAASTPGLTPPSCPRPAPSSETKSVSKFTSKKLGSKFNVYFYFRFGFFRPSLRSWPGGWACPREVGAGVTPLWTRGFCSDHLRVLCYCLSLLNIFYWTIITKYLITVLWSNLLSSVCTWWCRLSTSWYTRAARKTGTLPGLHTPLGLFQDLEKWMRRSHWLSRFCTFLYISKIGLFRSFPE